jgi:hypothetical protein
MLQARKTRKKESQLYYEFQYYGNLLAEKLTDKEHTSLYMKLAERLPVLWMIPCDELNFMFLKC